MRDGVRRFARQCLAFARRDLALERSYAGSLALGLGSGVLGLLAYHFVGRLVAAEGAASLAGGSYFAFVCTGLMMQLVVVAFLGALGGALAREAGEGTLETALAASAHPLALVLGRSLVPTGLAALQASLYAAVGALALELDLSGANWLTAALALAAVLAACAPLGLLGAAAWLELRRPGLVTTLVGLGFGLVGGVYFPVELLPGALGGVAAWVPLTAGLEALRAGLLEGAAPGAVLAPLARVIGLAAVGLPLSAALLFASLTRARRRGTLALA